MTTVTLLPFGRPLTRADLEHLPDDGHRYELVDGTLLVSPALELQDGAYREAGRAAGAQAWTAALPYPVTVVPADLVT